MLIICCLQNNSKSGLITILTVYVDDMVVTRNDKNEIEQLKCSLAKESKLKTLECLKYFLGMQVARSKKVIVVAQMKHTLFC